MSVQASINGADVWKSISRPFTVRLIVREYTYFVSMDALGCAMFSAKRFGPRHVWHDDIWGMRCLMRAHWVTLYLVWLACVARYLVWRRLGCAPLSRAEPCKASGAEVGVKQEAHMRSAVQGLPHTSSLVSYSRSSCRASTSLSFSIWFDVFTTSLRNVSSLSSDWLVAIHLLYSVSYRLTSWRFRFRCSFASDHRRRAQAPGGWSLSDSHVVNFRAAGKPWEPRVDYACFLQLLCSTNLTHPWMQLDAKSVGPP